MNASPLRRAAKAATSPVRGYLNDHFEMVKDEVRRVGETSAHAPAPAPVEVDLSASWVGVVEMENAIAELSLYQGRLIARLTDEVSVMSERVADLERIVAQLAEVVTAARADR